MTVRIDSRRVQRAGYRYAAAVILTAAALLITRLLVPPLGGVFFLVSWVAVTLAALFGGVGAGFLATGGSAAGYAYYLFEPLHSFSVASPFERLRLLSFVSACSVVSVVSGFLRSRSLRLPEFEKRAGPLGICD